MSQPIAPPSQNGIVLILGSGPSVLACRGWPRAPFDRIVAINNAWAVRHDWDDLVYPEDFATARLPVDIAAHQRLVDALDFVPAQNRFGGFVFGGGTMAFTAAYWALDALAPRVLAFLGCDMVYPAQGQTHFYGQGSPDPLRDDISLRDLGAKSARLAMIARAQGCLCVNLSQEPQSALLFDRAVPQDLPQRVLPDFDEPAYQALRAREAALGYDTPTGRYDAQADQFDRAALNQIDRDWRQMFAQGRT